jgi:DNA polymerase-3 subunit delta
VKNRQELDQALAAGTLSNAMMLFGESHFLIDRYSTILTNVADANLLKMYHDEYAYDAAKAHLSQGSLFGGANVLLIKSEKKIPKAELDRLLELCQKNSDNIFIYAYYGDDYKTSNKSFTKKAGGDFVRLYNPFAGEAINIVKQEAQHLGAQLDHYSLQHLLASQNGDIALACNELSKLAVLKGPVTTKEIDELVFGVAEVKIEQLIMSLLNKQDFKKELEHILESGEDEIRIITAISGFLTQLYMFYVYIKLHGTPSAKEILGYEPPRFIVEQRAKLSMKFKQETYEKILTLLLETELQMKSGVKTDNYALLLSTLLKLQSII